MKKYLFIILALLPITSSAHVRYLVEKDVVEQNSGVDNMFLLQPLTEPLNLFLMFITIAAALGALYLSKKLTFIKKKIGLICKRANGYKIFIPWILRLSAGIALIGSGVSNSLVSPVVSVHGGLATLEILLGFLLMAGFLVVPTAMVSIFLYILAFQTDWYVLGNLDFLAVVFALLLVDNERPGIDDLLGIPHFSPFNKFKKLAPFVLRVGIGGAMMFLAVYEKFLNPHISEIIVRNFGLMDIVPLDPSIWVLSAGIIEFAIGAALLVGYRTRLMSTIAFAVLSLSFFHFGEDV
ncbi:MAG: hypothetical protein ACI9GH_000188, partial [Candidatus Paceibacteria bacterium]